MNPARVEGKKVFKFDIGEFIEVKYKYPKPQGNIQKRAARRSCTSSRDAC